MTSFFGTLITGASAVQVPAFPGGVCKLAFQRGATATGTIKIGGISTLTADDTTPGTYIGAEPSGWSIETHKDANTIHPEQYWIQSTIAGDKVMYQINQA
jgi:hypothetical protein